MPPCTILNRGIYTFQPLARRGKALTKHRTLGVRALLVLCGIALGSVIAWFTAQALQLRSGEDDLRRYALHVLANAEDIANETRVATDAIDADNLPFCSDEELAFMRRIVFYSVNIKDLGRSRDGRLYCTTSQGRLAEPLRPTRAPDAVDRGVRFYALTPLAVAPGANGMVVATGEVSFALNPQAYEARYDAPPMIYTILFFARESRRAYYALGHHEPLSNAQVMAQQIVELRGIFYQPLCSTSYRVCIVAAEPRVALLAHRKGQFGVRFAIGALLGGLIPLTFILFFSRQRTFARQLRRALRRGELSVAYQPVVDLHTRAVVGAEALARWIDSSNESVPADQFIAAAERAGFINEITQFVLNRVVEEIDDLLRRDHFQVTVNITMQDLGNPDFFDHLRQSVEAARIDPGALGLELTERSTANREAATEAISRLKASGHHVYIDDFGTGYSSLAYLHELAADAIKIDRAFTATVGTQAVTASVVPQILDMASQLDLKVVVEGIESERQVEYFSHAGRGILGQGYLFGEAVPAEQFKSQFRAALHENVAPLNENVAPLK
jgi:sensor c-di-GMP phosphodiesterase-like protein